MVKLSTKQAIRQALRKKKGKKSVTSGNITVCNDEKYQDVESNLPEILDTKMKMAETENTTTGNNLDNQEPSGISIEDRKEKCVIKEKLTLKELKFLELYLTDGMSIDSAMIAAGYGNVSKIWRYNLAKRIILKHECRAGDHRKIFRIIGAGETAVAMGLLNLAQNAKSEMVKLNAWASLAKILGLTKEVLEQAEGIQIIINSSKGLAKPGDPPTDLPPSSGDLKIAL